MSACEFAGEGLFVHHARRDLHNPFPGREARIKQLRPMIDCGGLIDGRAGQIALDPLEVLAGGEPSVALRQRTGALGDPGYELPLIGLLGSSF